MVKNIRNVIIAIDGHSSCGKSTVAKQLAEKLDFIYVDSGAMYRAVTYYCLQNNIISQNRINHQLLIQELEMINIEFIKDQSLDKYLTILNGEIIEEEIRKIKVSEFVSQVSKIREVREKMVNLQREVAKNNSIVMDGRDIGTIVFPNADLKIFMTADTKIRAERRYKELLNKGHKISLEEVERNITERDEIDQSREISPLKKADDAIVLDNSFLNHEEQLSWALKKVSEILANN